LDIKKAASVGRSLKKAKLFYGVYSFLNSFFKFIIKLIKAPVIATRIKIKSKYGLIFSKILTDPINIENIRSNKFW
jgi:hypothetical protein